ncbi:hypothetical protein DIE21_02005 [Burkholderia sp. Bp9140]|nr:hypothetical protein DIE21_02005 [Burkholderia sp. Bp9140]
MRGIWIPDESALLVVKDRQPVLGDCLDDLAHGRQRMDETDVPVCDGRAQRARDRRARPVMGAGAARVG